MRLIATSLVFTCMTVISYAQNICFISGTIKDLKEGTIFIFPSIEQKEYYGEDFFVFDSSVIRNGSFYFEIRLREKAVFPFRFLVRSVNLEEVTADVFLEPGHLLVSVDSLNEYAAPQVYPSTTQKDYSEAYLKGYRQLVRDSYMLDSVYEINLDSKIALSSEERYEWRRRYDSISSAGDEILESFINSHSLSAVAHWKLIQRFEAYGFRDIYLTCFNKLSEEFRVTVEGQELKKRMAAASVLRIGAIFPDFVSIDDHGNIVCIDSGYFEKNSFTLIDFWFHNCAPCIRQFAEMKEVYANLRKRGFDVVSISVDKSEDLANWRSRSREIAFPWTNLIDIDGRESGKFLVNSFPRSYLVDRYGRIVKRNVDLYELNIFLEEMINRMPMN